MSGLLLGRGADRWVFDEAQSSNDCQIISKIPPFEPRPFREDEVEYVFHENHIQARLKHPGENPSLGSDAGKVTYHGPWHLCNSCLSAIGYLVRHHQQQRAYELANPDSDAGQDENHPDNQPLSAVQHGSFSALLRGASSGCHVCKVIKNSCRKAVDEAMEKAPRARPPFTELLFNDWDETGEEVGDFRLVCAFNTVRPNEPPAKHNYVNVVRFQLWPSPEMDRYFPAEWEMHDGNSTICDRERGVQDDIENRSTRSSRTLALRWLRNCLANEDGKHGACNANETSWLPTRLLDVGDVQTLNRVRLVSTSQIGLRNTSKYITLSHCWGEWGGRRNLPMLTQSTLSSMQVEGLDYELLPKTFKDAVDITCWFDIKYLWIDSLCIIQDAKSDWIAESSQMSHIYANALLNISASHSSDARGGCFISRDPAGYEPFKLKFEGQEKSWWVTLDERNLFDWVTKEPLATRAWVYQERQLSPRILHFTGREVFWECMAEAPSFKSELWPQGSPLERDFLGQSKINQLSHILRDHEIVAGRGNPAGDIWDEICQGFSKKRLSYSTDKLPSLSGLAHQIGKTRSNDTYLAGHWRSSLPRTLLWSIDEDARKIQIPSAPQRKCQQYVAPSWSWLSSNTAIHAPPYDHMHSVLDINFASTTLQTSDPYGRISDATLRATGFLRRITCSTEPSPFTGFAYELYKSLGLAEHQGLYVDGNLEKEHEIGFVCGAAPPGFGEEPDFNLEGLKWRNYYCLFVGVAVVSIHGVLRRSMQCLLLEHVEGEEPVCFRRVGRLSVNNGYCALGMRYKLKGGYKLDRSESGEEPDDEQAEEADISKPNRTGHAMKEHRNDRRGEHEVDHDEASQIPESNEADVNEKKLTNEGKNYKEFDYDENARENTVPPTLPTKSLKSDKGSYRQSQINTLWGRFWRQVAPHWDGGDPETSPKEISISTSGPMSLYEYDGGIENDAFEKLTPREVTLI